MKKNKEPVFNRFFVVINGNNKMVSIIIVIQNYISK